MSTRAPIGNDRGRDMAGLDGFRKSRIGRRGVRACVLVTAQSADHGVVNVVRSRDGDQGLTRLTP